MDFTIENESRAGVSVAASATAPVSSSPSAPPAAASGRRRRNPTATIATSATAAAAVPAIAAAPGGATTPTMARAVFHGGGWIHHGHGPSALTAACQPPVTPKRGSPAVAVRKMSTRFPGRCSAWSASGALQHTSVTAAARSHDRRRAAWSGAAPEAAPSRATPKVLAPRRSAIRPPPATATAIAAGSSSEKWTCATKLATRAVRGRSRCSPVATDQARKNSSNNGSSAQNGFTIE